MSTRLVPQPAGGGAGVDAPSRSTGADRLRVARATLGRNGLAAFFVILLAVFAVIKPGFLSSANIIDILRSASIVGILACGQTIVMLTGGFDLSVAKVAVFSGMIVVVFATLGALPAVILTLAVAALIGTVNGTLIARARVNPFVVTLGMFSIVGSLSLLVNNGEARYDVPGWLTSLTSGKLGSIPGVVLWFAAVAVACHLLLSYTRFGRHVYAVGGNYEASRLAGIRVDRVLVVAYVLTAAIAGLAGLLLTSRLQSASPVALPGVELDAIAAVIIGGTRLGGGFGSIPRTIMGALILACLSSALVFLNVAPYWQGILKGSVIIAAVAVDVLSKRTR